MSPRNKLRVTGVLFWAVLLGLIFLGARCARADEGKGRGHEFDDGSGDCLVPEAKTTGAIVVGLGLVGFGLWQAYRRNRQDGGGR